MTYTEFNFDKVTNAADFSANVFCQTEDGGAIGLFADSWTVTVNLYLQNNGIGHGYHRYDNTFYSDRPILTASSSDSSLDILTGDYVQWTWTASQMRTLGSGTYVISGVATKDDQTIQLFLANLPVIKVV